LFLQEFLAMNECLPPGAPIVPIADDVVEHIQSMWDDIAG